MAPQSYTPSFQRADLLPACKQTMTHYKHVQKRNAIVSLVPVSQLNTEFSKMSPRRRVWWTVMHKSWLWTQTHNFSRVTWLTTVIAALSQKPAISCMHYKLNLIFVPCALNMQIGTNSVLCTKHIHGCRHFTLTQMQPSHKGRREVLPLLGAHSVHGPVKCKQEINSAGMTCTALQKHRIYF